MSQSVNRPGSVVAAAILMFIAGGFSVIGPGCAFGGKAVQEAMPKPPQVEGRKNFDPKEIERRLEAEIPGKMYVDYGLMGFGVLFGIIKIVVGIGLLKLSGWSRPTAFMVALLSILITLGHVAFQAIVEVPASQRIVADVTKDLPPDVKGGVAMFTGGLMYVIMIVVTVIVLAYWSTVVFLLSGERIRTAFADAGKEPAPQTEEEKRPSRYEGYEDESDRPPETGIKE